MPRYNINGKWHYSDSELSPEDLDALDSSSKAAPVASATPTDDEDKPSLYQRLTKGGILDPEYRKNATVKGEVSKLLFGEEKDGNGRPILGPGIAKVPGTDKLKTKIDDIVNPPSENPGVVRPFISGALGGVTDLLSSGVADARFAVPGTPRNSNPETYKAILAAADKGLPIDPSPVPIGNIKQGPKNAALGLPAMGESGASTQPRTFFNGPAGTTQAGKSYPIDIAPQTPRLGQTDAGTILPRETEGLSNLDPITAANRGTKLGDIQSLPMDHPRNTVISLDKVRNGEPIKMPQGDNLTPGNERIYRGGSLTGNNDKGSFFTTNKDEAIGYASLADRPEDRLLHTGELPTGKFNAGNETINGNIPETWASDHRLVPNDKLDAFTNRAEPGIVPAQTIEGIGDIHYPTKGNIGDPSLPYQLDSAPKEAKFKPQTFVPDTPENGVATGPNKGNKVDTANLSQKDNNKGVPTPGQAVSSEPNPTANSPRSKDINSFRAEFGSVDKTLSSRTETKPIADAIISAADQKGKWIATTERQLADITKDLSKGDAIALGDIVNTGVPSGNPNLDQRAADIKKVMDAIHSELKLPQGMGMGYIENYLTHIDKLPEDDLKTGMKQIWEYHVGKPFKDIFGSAELSKGSNGLGDMYERGLGNPDSPFRKARGVGDNIELNVNKVLPAYIESIARLKFDRPAVDAAKQVLATLPDKDIYGDASKIKELAKWYVKNYSRYDAMPGLSQGWNDVTQKLMRVTGRSMLGFSTGLQTLHLARIPANLYPELGGEFLGKGAAIVAKNPIQAYHEAASLGLLQNEVRPWSFKTPMQKVDSILSFMSAADFLDKSIGYHGFKAKFIAEGMDEATASAQALSKTKNASLTVDAARPIKSFNPSGSPIADGAWKLATQFKQVPVKIIEQYVGIAAQMKQDPKQAARMVAGVGLAVAAQEAGLHTFHISPKQAAIQMGGAVGTVVYSIYKDLAKGDVVNALKKTALWITPAGMSIERQLRRGMSAFESDDTPKLKP